MRNRLKILKAEYETQKRKSFTQDELAIAMGVSRETVSRMMRNEPTRIDSNSIMKICVFFRKQPGDLLFIDYDEVDNGKSDQHSA